jgi:hypothetical protein
MKRGLSSVHLLPAAVILAVLPLVTSCSGGGGGSGSGTLFIESVDVAGRTDVERNRPITVTFNSPIDPETLSVAGFQIRAGTAIYQGRVVVDGNIVRFYPTILAGDPNDYTPDNNPPINGIGFPAATKFQLVILGNSPLSTRNKRGRSLTQSFSSTFSTGSGFLPESPPVAPRIAALPTFNQVPRNIASSPDTRDPNRAPEFDPSNVRVTLQFTEVMDPGLFNPFLTFSIANVTEGFPGAGSPTLGNIVPTSDGTAFVFTPLFTLGDNPGTADPFLFRIRVNGILETNPTDERALSDLSGNTLEHNSAVEGGTGPVFSPIDFYFKTIDKEGEPNFGSFTDDFISNANRGGSFDDPTTCIWPSGGYLEGSPATRNTVTIDPTDTGFLLPQPLTIEGNRMQFLYFRDPDLMGIGLESLIGWEWGPRSNFVFAADYPSVTMAIGHSNRTIFNDGLAFRFQDNFGGFPNNPTIVFSGDYEVQNSLTSPYFAWPEFQTDFEFNGTNNLCLELNVPPGAMTFQLFRNNSTAALPRRRVYGAAGAETGPNGENTIYHARFSFIRKKSFGISKLIDTLTADPDYTEPLVIADANRVGASYALSFKAEDQGAGGSADGNRVGPFSDINRIDGRRFFIFRFELNADPFTGVIPRVDSLSLGWKLQ